MKNRLDLIETALQTLIEGSIFWIPWKRQQPKLAAHLAEEMRQALEPYGDNGLPAPNLFSIYLHPQIAQEWKNHPDWIDGLIHALQESALEAGINFYGTPEISINTHPVLDPDKLKVSVAYPVNSSGSTAALSPAKLYKEDELAISSGNAYLILNNSQHFPINLPVINIGRQSDNHLVIEDLRVSRSHAQIRKVHGKNILFDLNSTGGTYANGKRITRHTLRPGDVISLAGTPLVGIPLIYGEDTTGGIPLQGTTPSKVEE
jgi:hypothetical protein